MLSRFLGLGFGSLLAAGVLFAGPAGAQDSRPANVPGARSQFELQRQPPPAAAVSLAALPPEARSTHELIVKGGPFPHSKDATVFGNRERLLPQRQRGYYLEYTVPTPGARDRGGRRLVCGGKPAARPTTCFYTDDHYASFRAIQP